jgi:hypothetical protein
MDFDHFLQSSQSSGPQVPDGFAIVPFPVFFILAQQHPNSPQIHVQQVVPQGAWNASLYERAMAVSPN